MEKVECGKCYSNCTTCDKMEEITANETDVQNLKNIRKSIMAKSFKEDLSLSDTIAIKIVSKVGTMIFFWACVLLATIPLIFPELMTILSYISSGYLQLILLPLIMVAGNISEKARESKSDREYRVLLINDRIDELIDENKCCK